jgi:putative SOS response-associated peptidase YedK
VRHAFKSSVLTRPGWYSPCAARYYRKSDKQKIAEVFHATQVDDFPLPPWDYNVAPTSMQPVISQSRDTGERQLSQMRWGLVPFFTKDLSEIKGMSTINARAETITRSATYREPFKKRPCLVLASGFFEWKKLDAKTKHPFAFVRYCESKGAPLPLSGVDIPLRDRGSFIAEAPLLYLPVCGRF